MGLLSAFLKKSVSKYPPAIRANPANRDASIPLASPQNGPGLAGLARLAGGYPESENCEPLNIESFAEAVQAYWPIVSLADNPPSIVKEEPFGLDYPPPLLKAAWLRLLEGRLENVQPMPWQMAVSDVALLFGDWGKLITEYRWTAADVFDHPAGLAWSIKGSPVLSIGKGMAMMRDERIWRKTAGGG